MSVAVQCPEGHDRYEAPDEAGMNPMRCRRCQCPIEAKESVAPSDGIQAQPALVLASTSRRREHDEDPEPDRPRRHPEPRAPFPLTALLIVVIGVLFFL